MNPILISFGVSYAVLFAAIFVWLWNIKRKKERWPLADKLLRAPGESLRRKLEELDAKLIQAICLVLVQPVWLFGVVLLSTKIHLPISPWAILIIGGLLTVAGFAFSVIYLLRVINQIRSYNLGFYGERAVGEELNQLLRDGCYVYHDLPMEPYGNIDHVIVAPSGVYAVETKTRRKKATPPGQKDYEVYNDGDCLEFPHFRDFHGLQQAVQQADRLRSFLCKAVGEPIEVTPILTLPGWFVTNRVKPKVQVLAPKAIRNAILKHRRQALSPQQMQRIAFQIEQRCRDVDL